MNETRNQTDQHDDNTIGGMRVAALVVVVVVFAACGIALAVWQPWEDESVPQPETVEVLKQTMQTEVDALRDGDMCRQGEAVVIPTPDHAPVLYGNAMLGAEWDDDTVIVTLTGESSGSTVYGFLVGPMTATVSDTKQLAKEFSLDRHAFGGEIPDDGSLRVCLGIT